MNKLKDVIKLTNRERAFCEYAQSGWIARDSDNCICLYNEKPYKEDYEWKSDNNYETYRIIEKLFQFIKWEDKEPYSVEEMLTWEVM